LNDWILIEISKMENVDYSTALKQSEIALYESVERYQTLFRTSRDAIVITKREGEVIDVNSAAVDLFGYTRDELLKQNANLFYADPSDREKFIKEIEKGGSVQEYEVRLKKKGGFVMDCLFTFSVRRNQDGSVMEYQGIIRDITEHKHLLEELRTLSLIDELTNIYNRRGFYMMAEQQMKTARRMNLSMCCIYIDLDNMKKINDTYGHHIGDQALIDTALLIKETFRESDIIGRLGGDEFAVFVINDMKNYADMMFSRLLENTKQKNAQRKNTYEILFSVGISRTEWDSHETLQELVNRSDSLMYKEKREKKERL